MASVQPQKLDGRLLLLDGFQTATILVQRWITLLDRRCPFYDAIPFSYNGWGAKYRPEDTFDSLLAHRDAFDSFLENVEGDIRIVGYSLGAVIGVFGAARWLERIKQIVLVAPAFTPSLSIIDEFVGNVPACLQPLLYPDDPVRAEIFSALDAVLAHKVPITVLYSDQDAYCPYLGLRGANTIELAVPPRDGEQPKAYHKRLRSEDLTLRAVCAEVASRA